MTHSASGLSGPQYPPGQYRPPGVMQPRLFWYGKAGKPTRPHPPKKSSTA